MAIQVRCTCGKSFNAKDEHAGKATKCPSCGGPLQIPSSGQVEPVKGKHSSESETQPTTDSPPQPSDNTIDLPGIRLKMERNELLLHSMSCLGGKELVLTSQRLIVAQGGSVLSAFGGGSQWGDVDSHSITTLASVKVKRNPLRLDLGTLHDGINFVQADGKTLALALRPKRIDIAIQVLSDILIAYHGRQLASAERHTWNIVPGQFPREAADEARQRLAQGQKAWQQVETERAPRRLAVWAISAAVAALLTIILFGFFVAKLAGVF